jgi:uncharacterized protein
VNQERHGERGFAADDDGGASMRTVIDQGNLPALARGCAVLGAGGGVDMRLALLMALQALEDHGPVPLVDPNDLPDDGLVMACAQIGTPLVAQEKIEAGDEGFRLRERIEELWQRPVVALMGLEIGGYNGILPVTWGARMGLPVLDADATGRAFPELQMTTLHLAGISGSPALMTDERGNLILLTTIDNRWMERLARAASVEMGGAAAITVYNLTAAQARTATVLGSFSLAMQIGRTLQRAEGDPVDAVVRTVSAFRLLSGKVIDVERHTTEGFMRGSVVIEGLGQDANRLLRLEIQNEYLVALERGEALASVPDNISVVDSTTAEAISTEEIRYGQRVTVIAFPSTPVWRTPRGIETVGPRAFGYDFDYVPVEKLLGTAGQARPS